MLRRTFLAGFAIILGFAAAANAGTVYVAMVLDPATTAGAGISTVPRSFSTGSFSVTSSLSGAGKWHLYALDDLTGSLGIAGFSVNISPIGSGTVTGILNRSPNASFTNYGDVDETVVQQSGSAGFSDALVRSGVGANPINPVQGNQVIGSLQDITGFGRTADNLNNTPNLAAPGDHRVWGGVTSGEWGLYATTPTALQLTNAGLTGANTAVAAGRKWLLLGEGLYTGGAPQFGAIIANYYDASNGGVLHQQTAGATNGNSISSAVIPSVPEPATLSLIGLAVVGGLGLRRRQS